MNRLHNLLIACIASWMMTAFTASANLNVYDFDDGEKQQQFAQLIDELRCPKCQNNNLADSNAPLARDIKNYVYQSVKAGKSNEAITDFLVSRYGEFITYRPRNPILWLLPTVIGGIALLICVVVIRRKRQQGVVAAEPVPDMASIIREHRAAHDDTELDAERNTERNQQHNQSPHNSQ